MTLYTAFDEPLRLPGAGLGPAESRLLDALFDADGATAASLGRRIAERRPTIEATLGALVQHGLVEHVARRAWLTGSGFGLRRALRPDSRPGA